MHPNICELIFSYSALLSSFNLPSSHTRIQTRRAFNKHSSNGMGNTILILRLALG
jgi:hypothetical protein